MIRRRHSSLPTDKNNVVGQSCPRPSAGPLVGPPVAVDDSRAIYLRMIGQSGRSAWHVRPGVLGGIALTNACKQFRSLGQYWKGPRPAAVTVTKPVPAIGGQIYPERAGRHIASASKAAARAWMAVVSNSGAGESS